MTAIFRPSPGILVSAILQGAWRNSTLHDLQLSATQLEEVTPLLYGSGAAALGWWRIRETELRSSSSADLLHQAYRLQTLLARIHQTKTEKISRLLRAAGVDSIVVKGWAVARHYPQPGLRPSGDIDLLIRPRDYRAAQDV